MSGSAFKATFKASNSMRSMAMMAKKPAPENPVAIVTGAARGIGKAIACALADTGCTVVVNYFVNETQALEVVEELKVRSGGKGGTAIAIRADCSNPAEVTAMFEEAHSKVRSSSTLSLVLLIAYLFIDFFSLDLWISLSTMLASHVTCSPFKCSPQTSLV